jgi:hypothetical protein
MIEEEIDVEVLVSYRDPVFYDLLSEIGFRRRQDAIKVRCSRSLTPIEALSIWWMRTSRLHPCWIAALTYHSRSSRELTRSRSRTLCPRGFVQQAVAQIARRATPLQTPAYISDFAVRILHFRKGSFEIRRQAVDYSGTPLLPLLAFEDLSADLPIKKDQFPVDRQGSAELGGLNSLFQAREKLSVVIPDDGFSHGAIASSIVDQARR